MQLNRVGHLVSMLAAATLLIACGSEAPQGAGAPATASHAETARQAADAAALEITKHMVSGVTNTAKPGAPVGMWFDLKDRPKASAPLVIDLAFVPQAPAENLRVTFIATDGLTLERSGIPAEFHGVEAGGVYRYELTVVPREDGAYYVSAIVLMDLADGPEARTFSIPIVVGAPADVAAKPAPPTDATGQPVESMPSN